jgi:hypothetical protein
LWRVPIFQNELINLLAPIGLLSLETAVPMICVGIVQALLLSYYDPGQAKGLLLRWTLASCLGIPIVFLLQFSTSWESLPLRFPGSLFIGLLVGIAQTWAYLPLRQSKKQSRYWIILTALIWGLSWGAGTLLAAVLSRVLWSYSMYFVAYSWLQTIFQGTSELIATGIPWLLMALLTGLHLFNRKQPSGRAVGSNQSAP